jgi:SsrA-binding protein
VSKKKNPKTHLTEAGKQAAVGKKSSSKKGKPGKKNETGPSIKMIAENRKARHNYEVLESVECGIILRGSEVKSLRNGKCSLDESYGRVRDEAMWLVDCDIPEYRQASFWNHEPKRPRKLLLHKVEYRKMAGRAMEKGLTLVPLRLYFNERGIAKCVIGLCKGRKTHDKREVLKTKEANRDMQRAMRRKY